MLTLIQLAQLEKHQCLYRHFSVSLALMHSPLPHAVTPSSSPIRAPKLALVGAPTPAPILASHPAFSVPALSEFMKLLSCREICEINTNAGLSCS